MQAEIDRLRADMEVGVIWGGLLGSRASLAAAHIHARCHSIMHPESMHHTRDAARPAPAAGSLESVALTGVSLCASSNPLICTAGLHAGCASTPGVHRALGYAAFRASSHIMRLCHAPRRRWPRSRPRWRRAWRRRSPRRRPRRPGCATRRPCIPLRTPDIRRSLCMPGLLDCSSGTQASVEAGDPRAAGSPDERHSVCVPQVALNARVAALQKQLQQVMGVNASLTAELEALRAQRVIHPGDGAHENGTRSSLLSLSFCASHPRLSLYGSHRVQTSWCWQPEPHQPAPETCLFGRGRTPPPAACTRA